ncbi:glycoside hydrolase family 130 protein [soil metagenome]
MSVNAQDDGWELRGDPGRVVARLFLPGESVAPRRSRAELISDRVRKLPERLAAETTRRLLDSFSPRHHDIEGILSAHAEIVLARIGDQLPEDAPHRLLLGATFTLEYAVEGAAVCNPSAVRHPDQSNLKPGQTRVALALRQIGEGHVSSIGFSSAIVGPGRRWEPEERDYPLRLPEVSPAEGSWSSYEVVFPDDSTLTQRTLLPVIEEERGGLEDARLVQFTDGGLTEYRATYTAYDGRGVLSRLLVSSDLTAFTSHRLTGTAATNKGMALFPRPIRGEQYALVRSDGESIAIAQSPNGRAWGRERSIRQPELPWELVQSGNCGPPIELPEGWLVLTHGVGPMRTYAISAILLDLEDPTQVRGVLDEPLLTSTGSLQPGYVPNVVYSCGGMVHDGILWIPYGAGDNRVRIASVTVTELLSAMRVPAEGADA